MTEFEDRLRAIQTRIHDRSRTPINQLTDEQVQQELDRRSELEEKKHKERLELIRSKRRMPTVLPLIAELWYNPDDAVYCVRWPWFVEMNLRSAYYNTLNREEALHWFTEEDVDKAKVAGLSLCPLPGS